MNPSCFKQSSTNSLVGKVQKSGSKTCSPGVLKPEDRKPQPACVEFKDILEKRSIAMDTAGAPSRTAYSPHRIIFPGALTSILYDFGFIAYFAAGNVLAAYHGSKSFDYFGFTFWKAYCFNLGASVRCKEYGLPRITKFTY